ncbi:MAG TPA: Uma2 family endonuclease [Streptosporangiaceae bacterium]|nr:Uma2 family endonuclease [Streptosporangiaceae bacterium]
MTIPETWPAIGQSFTTDDLDRMPDDGRRYELLDGVLVVSPRPGTIHQAVAGRLAAVLSAACPNHMLMVPEPAVQLTRTTEFDPDITVVRLEDVGPAKFTAPPLLAVEVRSPSTAMIDLTRKKDAYAAFGVPSYWIVVPDVRRPELTVFELADGRYEESGHVVGDQRFGATRPFPVEVVPARLVEGLGG